MNALTNISPIDGRYTEKTKALQYYFSEFALIKYRLKVEIAYFIALSELQLPQLKKLNKNQVKQLNLLVENFNLDDAKAIKEIEKITNHDVKAVEYFLKSKMEQLDLSDKVEFIHFGLTSQDINNTAIPISLKEFFETIYTPKINELLQQILLFAKENENVALLARTHGQPASPTRLGKEIQVFSSRIQNQLNNLQNIPFTGKFSGATGNFNAHHVAFPNVDWKKFADHFLLSLGLQRQGFTTQIENYDYLAAFFDNLRRINIILLDYCRDVWAYISLDYFQQKINPNEVGSSAMPHKINPIDFENAEGNLGIANALLHHLAEKLPISRLQRDLTDSTVLRNIGVPLAHIIIALDSILKGNKKLIVNHAKIEADLDNNWAVIAEAIQTVLRREHYPKPYEKLKALTRHGEKINQNILQQFITELEVSEAIKEELRQITPFNYTGI